MADGEVVWTGIGLQMLASHTLGGVSVCQGPHECSVSPGSHLVEGASINWEWALELMSWP
jgi:hypothetical protein